MIIFFPKVSLFWGLRKVYGKKRISQSLTTSGKNVSLYYRVLCAKKEQEKHIWDFSHPLKNSKNLGENGTGNECPYSRFLAKTHTGAKILNLSKNSQFENLIFHKIHNLKISFFTKFTIWKSHFFPKFTIWKSYL